jgi:hypothetical protein
MREAESMTSIFRFLGDHKICQKAQDNIIADLLGLNVHKTRDSLREVFPSKNSRCTEHPFQRVFE